MAALTSLAVGLAIGAIGASIAKRRKGPGSPGTGGQPQQQPVPPLPPVAPPQSAGAAMSSATQSANVAAGRTLRRAKVGSAGKVKPSVAQLQRRQGVGAPEPAPKTLLGY